ncbi:MAG: S41 family peptidase [Rickettsiaceae bacterium]|nr:S41 family peptidase [Rickettsiaceae bacterium]
MFKKVQLVVTIYFCILGINICYAEEPKPDSYYFEQFKEVFKRIEKDYIQVPNHQEMIDEAINGMLQSLDPYSSYVTDEDLEFFMSSTDGEFGGIGIELMFDNGVIKVITPIDDMPAYNAGIKAGDYIVGVNGKLVSNLGFNKAVKEMRGEPGSKLNLLVINSEENVAKEIEITRKIIKIKPIKYEVEESNNTGIAYIRIIAFNNNVITDLKKSIESIEKDLKSKNKTLSGIILDLRNNPGGVLDQALAVSEYFIDQGIITSIKGRNHDNPKILSAGRFVKKAPNVPLVVLINEGTASAAEIVAGALQDHKRGILVGVTSFGKGLVQTFSQISKRAAVKLTTAKYFTPSGRSINGKGIEPDIYIENAKVEYAKIEQENKVFTNASVKSYLEKYNQEEIIQEKAEDKRAGAPKIVLEKYQKDYQYARAFDLIRGLIVSKSAIK